MLFADADNMQIAVLFPEDRLSPLHRAQMASGDRDKVKLIGSACTLYMHM